MTILIRDRYHVASTLAKLRGEGITAVGEANPERQRPNEAQLKVTLEIMQLMIGAKIAACSAPDSGYMVGGIVEEVELHEAGVQNGALLLVFGQSVDGEEHRRAALIEPGCEELEDGPFTISLDSGKIVTVSLDRSCERQESYNECGIDQLGTHASIKLN